MPNKKAAKRALDVINNLGGTAEEFRARWLTLHAFSSEFEGKNQRRVLIDAIVDSISEEDAKYILETMEAEINYLASNPVGNLDYDDVHPNFYQNAMQDIAQAQLSERATPNRVGHLLCVVYQVRCNIEHGKKKLSSNRSQKLFSISNKVLDLVIPILVREHDAA